MALLTAPEACEAFASVFAQPTRLVSEPPWDREMHGTPAGAQRRLKSSLIWMTIAILPRIIWMQSHNCFVENPNLGFVSGRILLYDRLTLG